MRGWLPRTLGPGQFNRATYYGSGTAANNLREDFRYIDQFGEIKIVANAEYRYTIAQDFFGSKLKGALFVDAGNVWRLHNQNNQPKRCFQFQHPATIKPQWISAPACALIFRSSCSGSMPL